METGQKRSPSLTAANVLVLCQGVCGVRACSIIVFMVTCCRVYLALCGFFPLLEVCISYSSFCKILICTLMEGEMRLPIQRVFLCFVQPLVKWVFYQSSTIASSFVCWLQKDGTGVVSRGVWSAYMQYDSVHGCHSVCCVVLLPLMSCVK